MASKDPKELSPNLRLAALHSLTSHPGWQLYCERAQDLLEKEVDKKIFDSATPPAEREILVRAREFLVEHCIPEKVRASMIGVADSEAKREQRGG